MINAANRKGAALAFLSLTSMTAASSALANECARIAENEARLACYDRLFRRESPPVAGAGEAKAAALPAQPGLAGDQAPPPAAVASKMTKDWDLEPGGARETFELRGYKPVYLLLGTHTSSINNQPRSDNPDNSTNTAIRGLSANEAQFQLSFKTKVWSNIFGDNGNLWVGYTQSSRWQIYSGGISRPFRETNYEPEAMLMFRTPLSLGNWNLRMSGIGLNHQSNGRSNPLSRSWNRVVGVFGIENGDTSIQVRPWWRIHESAGNDNNPDIENYVGRGELIIAQRFGGHIVALTGRHSLRGGENSHGSIKIDWAIPISGHLRGHLSVFSGYGESMIDYNHRQTMFGAGLSLLEW